MFVLLLGWGWIGLFTSLIFLIPGGIAYLMNASSPNNVSLDDLVFLGIMLLLSVSAISIAYLLVRQHDN